MAPSYGRMIDTTRPLGVAKHDAVRGGLHPELANVAAEGDERARLWDLWKTYGATDTMAARRPTETAIVVLEPRD